MMRTLLAWLVVVSIFVYSYFGSFAYFSDSASIRLSLQMEQTSVQISCENLTLVHCHCPCSCSCGYYILRGIIVKTTGNSTLDGIYFSSRGWVLGGVIVDNSSFNAGAGLYLPLNATLSPGVHDVSLILYKTNSRGNRHAMYLVFYIDGREYPLSIVPRWCRR
ncbi:conserved protein of unknown function [Thermococcus nautili]|uniref:hypothetical protein n=1 Tax=Thermococcus nautili TaxID=195522 RepID=UPI002557BE42|nr:hypothetical protein [Thermococcus nautili]CAI1492554.1 conserved protein of unknown function [Thermococcus nautili]